MTAAPLLPLNVSPLSVMMTQLKLQHGALEDTWSEIRLIDVSWKFFIIDGSHTATQPHDDRKYRTDYRREFVALYLLPDAAASLIHKTIPNLRTGKDSIPSEQSPNPNRLVFTE